MHKEAKEQGKTATAHWAHMLIHGILHLQGFDHDTNDTAAQMEDMEIKILKSIGIENPYSI